MNQGFFTLTEPNKSKPKLRHSTYCGACGLHKYCQSPKMAYKGGGRKKILVIGEAPGAEEDKRNEQFVGKAGQRLKYELKKCGISLHADCWKTNAIRCHPIGNATPDSKQIGYCRPALFAEIKKLNPHSILLFGGVAADAVLGHLWNDGNSFTVAKWTDWLIPHQELNCWISVHYHPSYLERVHDDLTDLLFRKHLKKAVRKKKRPWKTVPNYQDEIELIYKPSDVFLALADMNKVCAFDYETNCLKPEYEGAEIVSCAFSDGKRTFAFPWSSDVAEGVSVTLKSISTKKIASNLKFEERWTRHFLKHRVHNWDWDTMLAAHVLNNATGITGLKFQSFVQLGQSQYDKHIEPYLKSSKGQHINRIREIPLKDLLVYNGLDSLLEFKLATLQKRRF